MLDKVYLPSPPLRPFIKDYWTCRHTTDVVEIMNPSGCVELCIDLTGLDTFRTRGGRTAKAPLMEILGHWVEPTTASIRKGNTCLVVRFNAWAATYFFSNPASELTNRSINLYDLFGSAAWALYDDLMSAEGIEPKIFVLEEFLIAQLSRNSDKLKDAELMAQLCQDVYRTGPLLNLEQLAFRYGLSGRRVQQLFIERVGVTPQKLLSLKRFNRSLELIRSSDASFTTIALTCGYYDQAHFIREFRSFTGVTPKQLRSPGSD